MYSKILFWNAITIVVIGLAAVDAAAKTTTATASTTKTKTTTIPTKSIGIDVFGKSVDLPLIGAGTWQYNDTTAYESLCKAFDVGITLVDTAYGYKNQVGVGRAIHDCFYSNMRSSTTMTTKITTTTTFVSSSSMDLVKRSLREKNDDCMDESRNAAMIGQQEVQQEQQQPRRRTRDDLFVLTKVPGGLTEEETIATHNENLRQLGLEYVDHLLVHYPADWDVTPSKSSPKVRQQQWLALEKLYYSNKARSIGVSHYCSKHIDDILAVATVPISINQVEYHVGSQDIDHVIEKCRENNITFMSFSPLCGPCQIDDPDQDSLITGKTVTDIGQKYNVTGAQVSLRFIVQQALDDDGKDSPLWAVIPKSNNIDHIRTNIDLLSFHLDDTDMWTLQQATRPPAESGDCDVP